jgi:hypothetical protein
MQRAIFGLSVVTALLVPHSPAAAESPALRPVSLLVSNLADVPPEFMTRARREVVRLYSRIGVTLIWEDQDPPSGSRHLVPSPERMVLQIVLLRDDARRLPDSQALGAAPLLPDEPRIASVYYSLAERAARRHAIESWVVLGHAIAHEVAHLIIPQYGHSSEGLMKAIWDRGDYVRAAQGQLRFSREQAALIRAALAR